MHHNIMVQPHNGGNENNHAFEGNFENFLHVWGGAITYFNITEHFNQPLPCRNHWKLSNSEDVKEGIRSAKNLREIY